MIPPLDRARRDNPLPTHRRRFSSPVKGGETIWVVYALHCSYCKSVGFTCDSQSEAKGVSQWLQVMGYTSVGNPFQVAG